ncbi:MAG: PrsW family intramembrane metalloprotease, partial [Myxococcales bacterium]|nr:PrsW family intramembrane metalloprotease [Myxococcales bacterium]
MSGLDALRTAAVIVPIVAFLPVWQRDASRGLRLFRPGIVAVLGGALAFAVSFSLRSFVLSRLGIADAGVGAFDLVALAFAVLVAAPVDETLRALAVVLPLRSKDLKRPYDAMRAVLGAALGFGAGEAIQRLATGPSSWLLTTRLLLDITAHVSLSCLWGFTLARERRRRLGGSAFSRAFLAVIVFGAVASELLFASGPMAIWAALPLVVSGVLIALLARRDLLR